MMKVFLAADHRGFTVKEALKPFLAEQGYEVEDAGAAENNPADDYVDFAAAASRRIAAAGAGARGIFICGTGAGMAIAANKHRGIRAALARSPEEAAQSREHCDANALILAADETGPERAMELASIFLATPFSGEERHVRRLAKIMKIENENFR